MPGKKYTRNYTKIQVLESTLIQLLTLALMGIFRLAMQALTAPQITYNVNVLHV